MGYKVMCRGKEIHTVYANSPLSKDDIFFLAIDAGHTENQEEWEIKEE